MANGKVTAVCEVSPPLVEMRREGLQRRNNRRKDKTEQGSRNNSSDQGPLGDTLMQTAIELRYLFL